MSVVFWVICNFSSYRLVGFSECRLCDLYLIDPKTSSKPSLMDEQRACPHAFTMAIDWINFRYNLVEFVLCMQIFKKLKANKFKISLQIIFSSLFYSEILSCSRPWI